MKIKKIKETEIAEIVIDWLEKQHWDVYQEVPVNNGFADIFAVRNGLVWVIETKTSLSFDVMEQAFRRAVHYRSVAVPKPVNMSWFLQRKIARDYLNIGILIVDQNIQTVNEIVSPKLMREYHNNAKRYISKLRPEHKTFAKAGSANELRFTPYQESIRNIKDYLRRNPGSTIKEIIDNLGKLHYSSNSSAKNCIKLALNTFESDSFLSQNKNGKDVYYINS